MIRDLWIRQASTLPKRPASTVCVPAELTNPSQAIQTKLPSLKQQLANPPASSNNLYMFARRHLPTWLSLLTLLQHLGLPLLNRLPRVQVPQEARSTDSRRVVWGDATIASANAGWTSADGSISVLRSYDARSQRTLQRKSLGANYIASTDYLACSPAAPLKG